MKNSYFRCPTYRSTHYSERRPLLVHLSVSFAALLFLTFFSQNSRAQQKPAEQSQAQPQTQTQPELKRPQEGQPKIAVEVKTVSVLATVRDKHGKIISNLTKDDFQLDEDGRTQTINYFAHESDLPLRLG